MDPFLQQSWRPGIMPPTLKLYSSAVLKKAWLWCLPELCSFQHTFTHKSQRAWLLVVVVAELCLSYRAGYCCLRTGHTSSGRRRSHSAVQPDQRPEQPQGKLLDEERRGDPGNAQHRQEHRAQVETGRLFHGRERKGWCWGGVRLPVSALQAEQTKRRRRWSVHVCLHLRDELSGHRRHRS